MRNPFSRSETPKEKSTYTLAELDSMYTIETAEPTHIVVSPKSTLAETVAVDMREIGATGNSVYGNFATEDYNPLLRGQLGLRKFDEMRRNDAQVKSSLRLVKTPVQSGRWYMEPASDRPKDKMIAKYMENCIFKWMSTSWPQFLTESLLMLDFGHYTFEKVFAYNTEPEFAGKIIWKKFAPRHPLNIEEWYEDENGGPRGIRYLTANNGPSAAVNIPISKLLVFTFDKEAGNMLGISLLRSAYKHWYYKENLYKVDAIQKERHGIGIPIIKLPPNFNENDKKIANEIGRNLRTNERAHVVLPPMWEIEFADLKGNPVDAMVSIEHHDMMIARNVIGQFLNAKGDEDQQALFIKSTRVVADIIRDVFNKYAIPELVNMNWSNVTDYPELRVRRIGESQDWRTLSFALRNFAGAGFIVPDVVLDSWLREELDLPKADPSTAREISTPQQADTGDGEDGSSNKDDPKKSDMPRQSTTPGMKQQAQGAGKKNVGNDKSGG